MTTKHSQPDDCLMFLEEANSSSEKNIIARFGNALEHGCLDEFLNVFTRNITNDDEVHKICKYLRSFRIFDEADQNRICNPCAFNTAERKATELLTEIGKRGQHAYWFLAHALKSLGTKQIPLFNYFHGEDFHCCVCKDIEQREREEQLEFPVDLDIDVTTVIATAVVSIMRAFKKMVEEKCTTAKDAVKKRAEEGIKKAHAKSRRDTDTTVLTQESLDDDLEPDQEDNINNEDLAGDLIETALSRMKAFKGKVEKKYSDAREAVKRKRKQFAANVKDSLDDDIEGTSPTTHPDATDKANQGKVETRLAQDSVVSKEQFCTVIRRKRAYKAAFVTLSAVTLFTFYPLPAFDFIFLFIYCNFLMLLITF